MTGWHLFDRLISWIRDHEMRFFLFCFGLVLIVTGRGF